MLTRLRSRRALAVGAIVAIAFMSLGARCIENTSVQKDQAGYTHIYGEMVNETDIQGSGIIVSGKVSDGAGNVLGDTLAPTCPPTLSPHSQVMYDIRFPVPIGPAPASHEVRPAAGKALEQPLTDPQVVVVQANAGRVQDAVFVIMGVVNTYSTAHTRLKGCVAVYDASGKVIIGGPTDVVSIDEDGDVDWTPTIPRNQPTVLGVAQYTGVPATAATARGWVWMESPAAPGTSTFQYFMTDQVPIQTQPVGP